MMLIWWVDVTVVGRCGGNMTHDWTRPQPYPSIQTYDPTPQNTLLSPIVVGNGGVVLPEVARDVHREGAPPAGGGSRWGGWYGRKEIRSFHTIHARDVRVDGPHDEMEEEAPGHDLVEGSMAPHGDDGGCCGCCRPCSPRDRVVAATSLPALAGAPIIQMPPTRRGPNPAA